MSDDLARVSEAEKKAVTDFDALGAAKKREIAACQKPIEDKVIRIGNLGVEIETMKDDLSVTEQDMLEDISSTTVPMHFDGRRSEPSFEAVSSAALGTLCRAAVGRCRNRRRRSTSGSLRSGRRAEAPALGALAVERQWRAAAMVR